MKEVRDLLLVFGTVQRVMRAERRARAEGLDVDVSTAPRSVSSECGLVLEARSAESEALRGVLRAAELEPTAVYRQRGEAWFPSSLDPVLTSPAVALTQYSRFGGCGAKLARGLLSTVLCGLPRLESEDVLVGIEFADDAGVLRVAPDLAIIHTVDFFPPIVDDPYSFGRIAATNALSDIYAMGGEPLAGMNLVSFPLESLGKEVLKEILSGGLSALADAGAVLAGGQTIEGSELLYGMAVTGKIHPDRIWRNRGLCEGDVLVLTKPLGTGILTTAAKAGLASPEHLSTAIRWMATLNREAAEAVHSIEPHAVTDVTGFGLLGHVAEMLQATDLTAELDLSALPVLPGAYEAASIGMVPAGAAKNRASVDSLLQEVGELDPVRVDLTLDPQTSGGLLVACTAAHGAALVRRLPAAAVIGRIVVGQAGGIKLVQSSS